MSVPDFGLEQCAVTASDTQDGQLALRFRDTDPVGALVVRWEAGKPPVVLFLDQAEAAALAEKRRPDEAGLQTPTGVESPAHKRDRDAPTSGPMAQER